jgi:hypothetical protein
VGMTAENANTDLAITVIHFFFGSRLPVHTLGASLAGGRFTAERAAIYDLKGTWLLLQGCS